MIFSVCHGVARGVECLQFQGWSDMFRCGSDDIDLRRTVNLLLQQLGRQPEIARVANAEGIFDFWCIAPDAKTDPDAYCLNLCRITHPRKASMHHFKTCCVFSVFLANPTCKSEACESDGEILLANIPKFARRVGPGCPPAASLIWVPHTCHISRLPQGLRLLSNTIVVP